MLFKASAPGSLMLLGEYAVLQGKPALVCAVNKRMSVTIEPRSDKQIIISSVLGKLAAELTASVRADQKDAFRHLEEVALNSAPLENTSSALKLPALKQLSFVPPFQFVIATLQFFHKQLSSGCNITIESEFSDKIGFGSSAAVTVALIKALSAWLNLGLTDANIIRNGRSIVRKVQGLGSGADVAACVLGGIVVYKMRNLHAEKLPYLHPITAVYSGYKTPTVEAVKKVAERNQQHPNVMKSLFQTIGLCAEQGAQAVRAQDWENLGKLMDLQQGLMQALGVSTPLLNDIVNSLQGKNILGAKISGSGLGDCVVALGSVKEFTFANDQVQWIPIEISAEGVKDEKI